MAEYIEREALLKEFGECEPQNWTNSDAEIQADFDYQWFRRIVTEAKTADVVEVRHGKWLKTEAYPHRVYCSVCHKTYVTNEEVIQGRSWEYPAYCTEAEYCPHCGAKMDGKGEGE